MKFESISIIATQKLSRKSDIEELKQFFIGYGINLKGLLFDGNQQKEEENPAEPVSEKKKPWWRIF